METSPNDRVVCNPLLLLLRSPVSLGLCLFAHPQLVADTSRSPLCLSCARLRIARSRLRQRERRGGEDHVWGRQQCPRPRHLSSLLLSSVCLSPSVSLWAMMSEGGLPLSDAQLLRSASKPIGGDKDEDKQAGRRALNHRHPQAEAREAQSHAIRQHQYTTALWSTLKSTAVHEKGERKAKRERGTRHGRGQKLRILTLFFLCSAFSPRSTAADNRSSHMHCVALSSRLPCLCETSYGQEMSKGKD